ncbi:MAG: hypothetical protein CM1200mP30_32530 [Pseudomonadota bacterium]|nr:MAG: hypothetical protein CM1200mP30_32530 [Pseudomonadota bacterium]
MNLLTEEYVFGAVMNFAETGSPARTDKAGAREFPPEIIEVEDPSFREGLKERHFKRPRYLSLWLALLAVPLIPSMIYWGIPGVSGWFTRFVPVSVEEQLGNYVVNELFPDRRICQADAGRKALDEMVMRLTTEESEYNFKVEVVDSDLVNAIAFPGETSLSFVACLKKARQLMHLLEFWLMRCSISCTGMVQKICSARLPCPESSSSFPEKQALW